MSLSVSGVLRDALVQKTITALEDKDNYISAPDAESIEEHPLLELLDRTGALDSVTAAAVIAEDMLHGPRDPAMLAKLEPKVAEVVKLLGDVKDHDNSVAGLGLLLESGNPVALKLAVAVIAMSARSEDLEFAKRQMGNGHMEEMLREFIDVSIEVADTLSQNNNWNDVPPALVQHFVKGVENISGLVQGTTRKKLLADTLENLQETLAQNNIVLPVKKAPVIQPGVAKSLGFDEILNDPLVQQTVSGMRDAPDENDLRQNPVIAALVDAESLDAVTASALIVMEGGHSQNLPREVKEVIKQLENEAVAFLGPLAMFETDNSSVHKIGLAAFAAGFSSGELARAQNELSGREMKQQMAEAAEAALFVLERVTETGTWKGMSPKLIDQFSDGLNNIKPYIESKTLKKLLNTALQTLKTEVAKSAAADITTPQAGKGPTGPSVLPKPKGGLKL